MSDVIRSAAAAANVIRDAASTRRYSTRVYRCELSSYQHATAVGSRHQLRARLSPLSNKRSLHASTKLHTTTRVTRTGRNSQRDFENEHS